MAEVTVKTLDNFKSALAGGGARPNMFEVSIPTFPDAIDSADWTTENNKDLTFLCKAAQLPASTVAPINVPFRGRILKVAGDRTFEPWTITIINDEDFSLRTAMEMWSDKMSNLVDATGVTNPVSYMQNAFVTQLGRGNTAASPKNVMGKMTALRTYKFYSIFPTNVSAIDLSYDSTDTVEEFTVEFQVQYYTIGETDQEATGDADLKSAISKRDKQSKKDPADPADGGTT